MQFGSVCSGIEAASVAWHPIGWKAAWLAEIEPFPCAVLAHHYPSVPNLGDMTTIARRVLTEEVPAPDVFCGGTPCQAFSVAGLRESLADERGNLTLKFVEIADAIDHVRVGRGEDECIVFWENVPGVLSTKDNAFGCFLGGLAGEDGPLEPPGGKWANAGAVYGPARAVAWRTLDAQYFGLAQRRRRVFVVASARDGFDPATVLFEWDGVRRDSAPSRDAGEGSSAQSAISVALRGREGGGTAELGDEVQNCLRASSGGGDKPHVLCLAHGQGGAEVASERSPTRTCNHEAPIVVHGTQDPCVSTDAAFALGRNNGGENVVAFSCKDDGGDRVAMAIQAGALRTNPESGPNGVGVQADRAYTLEARSEVQCVQIARQVRRLTPRESERLQGFPDDWTLIPWRKKPASECPDGSRYKALGNSWAVPVVSWIGSRIQQFIDAQFAKDAA